ncbi:helix-turn-helix transcriptional regulator, partial [Streptomyces sp. SID7982]|nr:helix-turn-helix transcriptional regulator [Streptomyces sp. SID7982]
SARLASGLSQGKVADAMNAEGFVFYQQTIAKVESGERPVRLDEATALARIFGADLGDALGARAGGGPKQEPSAEGGAPT